MQVQLRNIELQSSNTSALNVLFYNFNTYFEFGEFEPSFFCDSLNRSSEKLIYIFIDSLNIVRPDGSIPDSIHNITAARRILESSRQRFRKRKQVIKRGESLNFSQIVNFRDFHLKPGTYKMKLLFIQVDVSRDIDPKELEEDLKMDEAYLFKGCLWSKPIDLIVE